jgi:hypothetical protein
MLSEFLWTELCLVVCRDTRVPALWLYGLDISRIGALRNCGWVARTRGASAIGWTAVLSGC